MLIGSACLILQAGVTPYNNLYVAGTHIAGNHFPIGSAFILTIIILGLNVTLRKTKPGSGLTPAELIIIWVIMSVGSGIPNAAEYFSTIGITPCRYATKISERPPFSL